MRGGWVELKENGCSLCSLPSENYFLQGFPPKIESWRGEPPETYPKRERVRGGEGAAKVIKRVKVALLGDIYKMALLTEVVKSPSKIPVQSERSTIWQI